MDYTQIISTCESRKYLISMVPLECIVELGYNIGLNKNKTVLDLCCGYGEMLRLWSEAFGIRGTGVDRVPEFIQTGKKRVNSKLVTLVCGDVLKYTCVEKYDVVICTELSGGLFSSFKEGIGFLERFIKPGGTLIFGKLFLEKESPPQELVEFDGELPTLGEIWKTVKRFGYHFTALATDTHAEWERYITARAKEAIEHLRQSPEDAQFAAWDDKWYRIYFEQRRQYEGWGLFAIEKI
jgi:SAM-dependent methyltransferase